MLSSTSSKREARSYLSRFNVPPKDLAFVRRSRTAPSRHDSVPKHGVNLGALFQFNQAREKNSVHPPKIPSKDLSLTDTEPLHIALVIIKSIESSNDETLRGIGHTLQLLGKLGLSCVVIVDPTHDEPAQPDDQPRSSWHAAALAQADRVVAAIEQHGRPGARRLDGVIGVTELDDGNNVRSKVRIRDRTVITNRKLLLAPLQRGIIPVIAPIGSTSSRQTAVPVTAGDLSLAFARDFAGLMRFASASESDSPYGWEAGRSPQLWLDRIIVLDRYGGIPSTRQVNGSHVFINLEQEYDEICQELRLMGLDHSTAAVAHPSSSVGVAVATKDTADVVNVKPVAGQPNQALHSRASSDATAARINSHADSLKLIRDTLAILPPSSSALLITPVEAASLTQTPASSSITPGVGTRTPRNPLIHYLLTDKPSYSSSLPRARLSSPAGGPHSRPACWPSTFVKRGMPVTMIPDPRDHPWSPSSGDTRPNLLSDPRIDLARLVHLIEDSFGRKLDVQAYLERISSNLAGIIIAGSYDGGAILTWETPPGLPSFPLVVSSGSSSPSSSSRRVPYLDKFAVLKRWQGSGGVADVIFSAMVRDCFPGGVCWRSRHDNPVNRWYFERAQGSWRLPDEAGWTMFWTTEGVRPERFGDYAAVCRSVRTTWADPKPKPKAAA